MDDIKNQSIGLVMTGGGARGAYQAGVLKRIGQIKRLEGKPGPFKIIGGASAGAVNGAAVATGNHDFVRCVEWVAKLWADLKTEDIYLSDVKALVPKAGRWIKDLAFGGLKGSGGNAHSLLDSSPLHGFLSKYIKTDRIQDNIDKGFLRSICISATNYSSGKNFFFIQAEPGHKMWQKSRRIALATKITVDHVCASSAIPVVFSPVAVTTDYGIDYFGDGCLRLHAPLSPVIRLGAERILAIGLRSEKADKENIEKGGPLTPGMAKKVPQKPPLAQILGVTLNAIFLDHLDADVEHLFRLNQIISQGKFNFDGMSEPIRTIEPMVINPSYDLGRLAETFSHKMPGPVRYFMAGLGTKEDKSSDLISYLLFDSEYTRALINMGFADADDKIDEIEEFLFK